MSRGMLMGLCVAMAFTPGVGAEPPAQSTATQQPVPHMGTRVPQLYMTKITVTDLTRSYDFYTKVLGLKLVTSAELKMDGAPRAADNERELVEVALNYSGSLRDPLLILLKRKGVTPSPQQAELTWLVINVVDTTALLESASKAGIQPFRPTMADGHLGFLKDPDGYSIEVIQVPPFPPIT